MDIYFLDLRKVHGNIKQYYSLVSQEKQKKIKRIKLLKEANLSLFGEILARYGIIKQTNQLNSTIYFGKTKMGKPYIKNGKNNIFFNISHSEDIVVCAVGRSEVGIDVEFIKKLDLSIVNLVYSDKEKEELKLNEKLYDLTSFYQIWTLKESFLKFTGHGLAMEMKSLSFNVDKENIIFTTSENTCVSKASFSFLPVASDYMCSICISEETELNLIEIYEVDFVDTFNL